jgi:hypothetical protein
LSILKLKSLNLSWLSPRTTRNIPKLEPSIDPSSVGAG